MVHLHNKKVSVKAHVFIRGRPTKILPQWIRCQLYTGRKKEIKPPTLDLFGTLMREDFGVRHGLFRTY